MNPNFISIIVVAVILVSFLIKRSVQKNRKQTKRQAPRTHSTMSKTTPSRTKNIARQGQHGERIVSQILESCAAPTDKIINDITLYHEENGTSSQIDHIYICTYGVYVIETKNYSGQIYGSDNSTEWMQILGYGKRTKNKFYSPVKQNATHLYAVRKLLPKNVPVSGCVVFVQGNTDHIDSRYIYTPQTLSRLLQSPTREKVLSPQQIEQICTTLCEYRDKYHVTESEHLQNIAEEQRKIAQNICPRCGGTLVLRHSEYGEFYGCSNYPACKFKKKRN